MEKSTTIWSIIILLAVGLLIIGSSTSSQAQTWADTDVPCLSGGHQGAATHIHADLTVKVNGESQPIPADIGINNSCMAEVHTHDRSGEIHIETADRVAERTVADFFAVWGKPLDRPGYQRIITVNGESAGPDYAFQDGDDIEVQFISTSRDNSATTTGGTGQPTNSSSDMTQATGTVTAVDFSAIVRDGDGIITIRTEQNKQWVIAIPARKMDSCLADKNMEDVINLATGTQVSVGGEIVSGARINPCGQDGYLRITE